MGFNLMREAESVDHVFEIIRTRFPTGTLRRMPCA